MIIDCDGAGAAPRFAQFDDPSCDTLTVKISSIVRPVIANVATLDAHETDIATFACAALAANMAKAKRLRPVSHRKDEHTMHVVNQSGLQHARQLELIVSRVRKPCRRHRARCAAGIWRPARHNRPQGPDGSVPPVPALPCQSRKMSVHSGCVPDAA